MREVSLSCLRVIEDKLDATAVLWKQGTKGRFLLESYINLGKDI